MTRNGPWPARAARAAVLVSILVAPGGVHGQEASSPGPISSGQEASAPGPSTSGQEASAPGPIRGLQEASAPGPVPSEPEAADAFVPPTLAPIPLPEPSTVAATPPAAPAPAPSTVRLALPALDRAWREPAADLLTRADRVRAAADALGIVDVEPVARALLLGGGGSPLERARAAVRVAPGLPAAQAALASAEWREGGGFGVACNAAWRALAALPRHLESRLWLEAAALTLLFAAALAAGLAWVAARGARAALAAAHDAADRLDPSLPGFARAALVAAAVLAPAALGEGALGAALGLFALAWWAADTAQRRTLAAAAALVALALGPLAGAAGRALAGLSADPVVAAVAAAETGFLDPADAARLERAADTGDPLALQALARHARRSGDLARAEALLAPLLAAGGAEPSLLNDAAHVRLLAGDTAAAIALYREALARAPSADLWFNLAQAHVRAIDMDAHADALAAAQDEDAARTRVLTQRLAESDDTLVDLPLAVGALHARLLAAADPAAGAALRATIAPGRAGREPWLAALLFAVAAALATALARAVPPSRGCRDCGARLCLRCGSGDPAAPTCAGCARKRLEARHGGPWERGERADSFARRAGRALARVLPGLLEPEPARPGAAFAALAALVAAALLAAGRAGVVPDPAAVGASGPLALAIAAGALALLGAGLALAARGAGDR